MSFTSSDFELIPSKLENIAKQLEKQNELKKIELEILKPGSTKEIE